MSNKKYDYHIGDVYNGREIIGTDEDKTGRKLIKIKCLICGKELTVRHGYIEKWECNCKNKVYDDPNENKSRLYGIWANMKYRCNTETSQSYFRYGAKGIKVCNEWNDSYAVFKKWALENGYTDELTIDRIDSTKNYCPENCQWLTKGENTAKSNKICQHRMADNGMYYATSPDGEYYEFPNANQFAREHNLNANNIRNWANGMRNCSNGWRFWH